MIIDQLSPTQTDNLTDEVPVEQGQLTFKTTWQKILNLFKGNISASDIATTNGTVQSDIGDIDLTTTATNLTDAINELDADLSTKQDTLVSGTNIKTVNGNSLLGNGDITIQGGGGAVYVTNIACSAVSEYGYFAEVYVSNADDTYVVADIQFANPSAITSHVQWFTTNVSIGIQVLSVLRLAGECVSATTADVVLVKASNL